MTCSVAVTVLASVLALACGGSRSAPHAKRSSASAAKRARDAGRYDASLDAAVDASLLFDASTVAEDPVERGRYLVESVAACGLCHTPRKPDGTFDETRRLSGVECLEDRLPDDPIRGCIHSRNLTNHETGLQNRTDTEIKDMFTKGERPDGKALHPYMPYSILGNMRDSDADAIVKYLRTVPGVDHMLPPSEPPFTQPETPAARWPIEALPVPRADYPDRDAALRGSYLAARVGLCMDCHTQRDADDLPLRAQAFAGGRTLLRPPNVGAEWPARIVTPNLTPDASGLAAWSVDDIARGIQRGETRRSDWQPACPPMRSADMSPFAGLTDADARDIAHFLRSLAPIARAREDTPCR
jgi:mono/diheme cytochrome c family protein